MENERMFEIRRHDYEILFEASLILRRLVPIDPSSEEAQRCIRIISTNMGRFMQDCSLMNPAIEIAEYLEYNDVSPEQACEDLDIPASVWEEEHYRNAVLEQVNRCPHCGYWYPVNSPEWVITPEGAMCDDCAEARGLLFPEDEESIDLAPSDGYDEYI